MTIAEAKKKLVSWCNAQVGTHEGANNYNKYAADPRIMQLLGWNAQNQPWCDIFTDEAFIDCFGLQIGAAMTYQQIGSGSALCQTSAQFFKSAGAWFSLPEVGDVVFFYVSGAINHQGIVTAVSGGMFTTIEGNSSDRVARRTYKIGDSSIAGFGRPKWELLQSAEVTDGKETVNAEKPQNLNLESHNWKPQALKYGAVGTDVYLLQSALVVKRFYANNDRKEIDGEFGAKTQAAVNNAKRFYGQMANGEADINLWRRLLETG